jgi:lipoprotein-anchoring transpeptidase ErfK/SrfK
MKKFLYLFILINIFSNFNFASLAQASSNITERINTYMQNTYPVQYNTRYILISVPTQTLYLINGKDIEESYKISTAKKGVGNIINSNKTPIGLHKIVKKIGASADIGTVIRKGEVTNEKAEIITEHKSINTDVLTTRVIWLAGMESGVNKGGRVDSMTRGIMIHGTPEEGLLGEPASRGCIRMRNSDIVDLFDKIKKDTKVIIENKF